jgi:hypothetical protein
MLYKTMASASMCNHRILSRSEMTAFRRQGFLKITAFAPPSDMAHVRAIIDDLYSHGAGGLGHKIISCIELLN